MRMGKWSEKYRQAWKTGRLIATDKEHALGVSLDLRKAAFHRLQGDILAAYTWVNEARALVLLPAHR